MLLNLASAILSSVLFCLSLAWLNHIPEPERHPGTLYSSFFDTMMIYMIYATPVYVIGGVPCSILIDLIQKKINLSQKFANYLWGIVAYTVAGLVTTFLFLLVLSGGKVVGELQDNQRFFLCGAIASLVYYHVYLAMNFLMKKRSS